MISKAREALWSAENPSPVTYHVGRKYVRCSDAVYAVPTTCTISSVSPTMLHLRACNDSLAQWTHCNLHKCISQCQEKGFNLMQHQFSDGILRLNGPWNTFNADYRASPHVLREGETVRVRVSPFVDMIAPNEFRIAFRAVDVLRVET